MKVRRVHLTLALSAVLALVALGIFLWIRPGVSEDEPTPPVLNPINVPAISAPQPEVFRTVEAPVPTVKEAIAPPHKESANLHTPVPLEVLATRYNKVEAQRWEFRDTLQKQINADPELTETLKAKIQQLESPLLYIALAEGLDDSLLRPAVLEGLEDAVQKNYPLVEMIEKTAERFGVKRPGTPTSKGGGDLAALLKALEPQVQADYERLRKKLEINEDVARALEPARGGDVLYTYMLGYMQKRGWNYSVDRRTFELRK
jgi:hypothetical protein